MGTRAGRAPPAASRRGARGGGSSWLRGVSVIYFGWAARAQVPRASRVWTCSWSRCWWGGEGAASTEAGLNRGPREHLWVGKINKTQDNRKKQQNVLPLSHSWLGQQVSPSCCTFTELLTDQHRSHRGSSGPSAETKTLQIWGSFTMKVCHAATGT